MPDLGSVSPLQDYIFKYDLKHIRESREDYYLVAVQQPTELWNKLLKQDVAWKKGHQRNVISSWEGTQGEGKSLPMIAFDLWVSHIFGVPLTAENLKDHLFYEVEHLTQALDNSLQCESFIKDEERNAQYGIMSDYMDQLLLDYEQQFRKKQINLSFASVERHEHAQYFVFETFPTGIEYDKNDFPVNFTLLLKMKRHSDGELMPRGLVKFPMIPSDVLAAYEELKNKHIAEFGSRSGGIMDLVNADAAKLVESESHKLMRVNQYGDQVPVGRLAIELVVYDAIGNRKYTTKGYALLCERVRQLLREKCEE